MVHVPSLTSFIVFWPLHESTSPFVELRNYFIKSEVVASGGWVQDAVSASARFTAESTTTHQLELYRLPPPVNHHDDGDDLGMYIFVY